MKIDIKRNSSILIFLGGEGVQNFRVHSEL